MAHIKVKEGDSERVIELSEDTSVVGRASECRIVLQEKRASRKHCQIERTPEGYRLVDLESRNGTHVNDKCVNQAVLHTGDVIRIGEALLTFEDQASEPPPQPAPAEAQVPPPPPAPAEPPPPAPPAASPTESTRARRRDGTTKLPGVIRPVTPRPKEDADERLLRMVATGAVWFGIIIILLLAAWEFTGESSATRKGREDFEIARLIHREQPMKALEILDHISQQPQELRDKVRALTEQIRQNLKREKEVPPAAPTPSTAPWAAEWAPIEALVRSQANDKNFSSAMDPISQALQRFNTTLDARLAVIRLHDEVLDHAGTFWRDQDAHGQELRGEGRKEEARNVYHDVVLRMGEGACRELEDYCALAHARLESLK